MVDEGSEQADDGQDEPHWLDDTEQRVWRQYLAVLRLLPNYLNRNLIDAHRLTLNEYEVLALLSEAPDQKIRMTELAEQAVLSKSRLSHQISRMERDGLVQREPCETDGRGYFAVLTTEGWKQLIDAVPTHVADVRRGFIDALTRDQLQALGVTLDAISGALTADQAVEAED